MLLPVSLQRGKLIKRYKRFLSDVELSTGEVVQAHCPNSGSMKGLCDPGVSIWVNYVEDPKRKLKYSWELVEMPSSLVGINTNRPNKLMKDAFMDQTLNPFKNYQKVKPEVQCGEGTRLDFLLLESATGEKNAFVEVKNVTLKVGDQAQFPDAVTTRGTKHLNTLINVLKEGYRAALVFVVQREDVKSFTAAKDIDPVYAETLDRAKKEGVEVYCYACQMQTDRIILGSELPVE